MSDGINLGKAYVQIIPSAEGIQGKLSSVIDGEAESAGKSGGLKLSSALGSTMKAGIGFAATGMAAVGSFSKAIIDSSKNTAAMGDNIDKLSQKIGISATAFQEWDYVFGQNGADIAILETGMKTLSSAVADAGNGSKSAMAKFEALGVSYKDLGKMSQEDIFSTVIARLQEMPEGAERTAIATDLLGRSAMELGPLLNQTAADTQALKDQAHDLGMIMSEDAVKNSAAFTDSMDNLSRAFSGAKTQMSKSFLPGLTEITNGLAGLVAGTDGASEQIAKGFKTIATGVTEAVPGIIETIKSIAGSIAKVAPELLRTLAQAIVDAIPELMPAVTDLIIQLGQMFIELLPQLVDVGLQVILQLALGIAQALPELVPTLVDCILTIVETLIDNVDLLVDASIAIIIGLAEGLIDAMPKLIEKAPEIIAKLVEALVKNAPKLFDAAIELIEKLIKGIFSMFPDLLKCGKEIVIELAKGIVSAVIKIENATDDIVDTVADRLGGLPGKALKWGKDLVDAFIDGMMGKMPGINNASSMIAKNVQSYVGFSEPEKGPLSDFHTFAPDMMQLFAQGIEDNIGLVTKSMDDVSNQIATSLNNDLNGAVLDVNANVSQNDRAAAGNVSMGGVSINVYGAPGQDERVIAQKVSDILNRQVINARAVFA